MHDAGTRKKVNRKENEKEEMSDTLDDISASQKSHEKSLQNLKSDVNAKYDLLLEMIEELKTSPELMQVNNHRGEGSKTSDLRKKLEMKRNMKLKVDNNDK